MSNRNMDLYVGQFDVRDCGEIFLNKYGNSVSTSSTNFSIMS